MALYNVGDRVVVREDLGTNEHKYRYGYGFGMERFCLERLQCFWL